MSPQRRASASAVCLAALCALASRQARAGDASAGGAPWSTQIDLVRATGMAGAMTAFASGNDALTTNPAGLALNHSYHFELDGMYDAKFPAEGVTLSIADSTTAAGVGSGLIFQRWGAGQLSNRGEGWQGGIAYAYQTGTFIVGGVTHLLHFATPSAGTTHAFSEDLGVMAHGSNLQFGASLQNINFSLENMPLFPTLGTVGLAVGDDSSFHLSADYRMNLADTSHLRHQLSFGGEVIVEKSLVLRTGYRLDISDHLGWWTCGASVVTQKFSIGAALRRRVHGDHMEQALEGGITLFLE